MKRYPVIATALSALLLLTSCGSEEILITGEVVSCNHIDLIDNPTETIVAECRS
jgi:hypothetical protein